MTKWFDTNYHYLVPELTTDQHFTLASRKPIEEYEEARALGYQTRPVLVGPVTFLKLAKSKDAGFNPLSLLDRLLPVYIEVLRELAPAAPNGCRSTSHVWCSTSNRGQQALHYAYTRDHQGCRCSRSCWRPISGRWANRDTALSLPVAGLHLDLVRAPDQLTASRELPRDRVLSLGVIDGRNIWRADLNGMLDRLEPVVAQLGERRVDRAVLLAAACAGRPASETDARCRGEVLAGLRAAEARRTGDVARRCTKVAAASQQRCASRLAVAARRASPRVNDPDGAPRSPTIATRAAAQRRSPRAPAPSAQRFDLPAFPTTTIGSFPQTAEIRKARAAHVKAATRRPQPTRRMREEIARSGRKAGRRSASTCSSTAKPSATTWSSTSASSSRASPSASTAGCSPTARAA